MKYNKTAIIGISAELIPYIENSEDERYGRLKNQLRQKIMGEIGCGINRFVTGMHRGVDLLASETVLEIKEKMPLISLDCAFPYEAQAADWPERERDRYFDIASKCTREFMISNSYYDTVEQKLNEYLLKFSDSVIAVWDSRIDTTARLIAEARRSGKRVVIIDPREV